MERTGIEPVTSGLQIQSNAGVGWSWDVVTAPPSHEPLRTRSPWFTIRDEIEAGVVARGLDRDLRRRPRLEHVVEVVLDSAPAR